MTDSVIVSTTSTMGRAELMTNSFVPENESDLKLRAAFGQYGTGVTVVTAQSGSGPIGMTANSFTSVSLDPPLILWSVSNDSLRNLGFVTARHFAIHVLKSDQGRVARDFARSAEAFGQVAHDANPDGAPLLSDCLARFECSHHAAYEGGDHTIIVGRVEKVTQNAGKPLLFYGGSYGSFKSATS